MKQVLTLVLALVVLALMSISCQSKSSIQRDRLQANLADSSHYIKAVTEDSVTVMVFHNDKSVLNKLSAGDQIWVYAGAGKLIYCEQCSFKDSYTGGFQKAIIK